MNDLQEPQKENRIKERELSLITSHCATPVGSRYRGQIEIGMGTEAAAVDFG